MSVLDQVAAEAVQRAISVVAVETVGKSSGFEAEDYCRKMVREQIEKILKEPDMYGKLKAKMIEIIDGLPRSLPERRGY